MPIIAIICLLLLFLKGKSTDPPKIFSNVDDEDSVSVTSSVYTGTGSNSVVNNSNGTVTIKATITKAKAQAISAELVNEFSFVFRWGNKELKTILDKIKNAADYALVYAAFGKHKRDQLSQSLTDGTLWSDGNFNLTEWISNEIYDDPELKDDLQKRLKIVF